MNPITDMEKAKLRKQQWLSGGRCKGGINRQNTEDFEDSKTILHDTTMADTSYIAQIP